VRRTRIATCFRRLTGRCRRPYQCLRRQAVQRMHFSVIRTPAESRRSESQTGSQRSPHPGDTRPRPAHIDAVRWHIRLRQAIPRNTSMVPSKQRVAGSNPAGRTHQFPHVKRVERPHTTGSEPVRRRVSLTCQPGRSSSSGRYFAFSSDPLPIRQRVIDTHASDQRLCVANSRWEPNRESNGPEPRIHE
jgi:hypothetical protein